MNRIDEAMTDIAALRAALLAGAAPAAILDQDAIPAALVPKDMGVESLEHLLPSPTRCRGCYTTDDLVDFLTYCAEQRPNDALEANSHIFYEADPPRASAILDFGSPEAPAWRQQTASWVPRESPAMAALRALLGRALDQETLANYIDDWADYLAFERADGTAVGVSAARSAISDLTIESIKSLRSKRDDFARERSALEKIAMAPTVPSRMILTCSPWVGFAPHQLAVRVSAVDSSTLALRLQLIAWPTHLDSLTDELRERLNSLNASISVLCGHM